MFFVAKVAHRGCSWQGRNGKVLAVDRHGRGGVRKVADVTQGRKESKQC